jgi:hypothetical protein
MKNYISNAIIETLLNGEPFSAPEAYALFGSPSLVRCVSRLRKQGFYFDRETVSLEEVYQRLDAVLGKKMPRPRYVKSTEVLVSQYVRNKLKEDRSATSVFEKGKNAAGLQGGRALR